MTAKSCSSLISDRHRGVDPGPERLARKDALIVSRSSRRSVREEHLICPPISVCLTSRHSLELGNPNDSEKLLRNSGKWGNLCGAKVTTDHIIGNNDLVCYCCICYLFHRPNFDVFRSVRQIRTSPRLWTWTLRAERKTDRKQKEQRKLMMKWVV